MLRVNIVAYEEPYELLQQKNHVILRHLYRFLPEESDKLGCHAGVIQVTLSLTHDNS